MPFDDYQQVVARLLNALSLDVADLPEKTGIRFDPDITINLELLPRRDREQLALTAKVGPIADFGTLFQVSALVAGGNFYWTKANGCTLSIHEGSETVYAQYAFPLSLLNGDPGVTDTAMDELQAALLNMADFVRHVRQNGLT